MHEKFFLISTFVYNFFFLHGHGYNLSMTEKKGAEKQKVNVLITEKEESCNL